MDIASYYFFMIKADVHERSVQYSIPAVSLHRSEVPGSATSGLMHRSKQRARCKAYSITSSARPKRHSLALSPGPIKTGN
jgi:hypothetical protein